MTMQMRLVFNSLHDGVATKLRNRIFSGRLAPGSLLEEKRLCAELAISRVPLREAFKVLVQEGLVQHEAGRGAYVSEANERDLDEVFPVLALLEGRCACEAAQRAGDTALDALDPLLAELRRCVHGGFVPDCHEAESRIHRAIVTLAGNRWLAQAVGDLNKVVRLARLHQLQAPGRLEQSLLEHHAIVDRLMARDAEGAEKLARAHVVAQRQALRELGLVQRTGVPA